MKEEPIPLPVKDVRPINLSGVGKEWSCDVTFGIPWQDGFHNDPTITVTSKDVKKFPQVGDFMLVYPPRVAGYANTENYPMDVDTCDQCRHQEGRHYCLLHSITVKNMDTKKCQYWESNERPED